MSSLKENYFGKRSHTLLDKSIKRISMVNKLIKSDKNLFKAAKRSNRTSKMKFQCKINESEGSNVGRSKEKNYRGSPLFSKQFSTPRKSFVIRRQSSNSPNRSKLNKNRSQSNKKFKKLRDFKDDAVSNNKNTSHLNPYNLLPNSSTLNSKILKYDEKETSFARYERELRIPSLNMQVLGIFNKRCKIDLNESNQKDGITQNKNIKPHDSVTPRSRINNLPSIELISEVIEIENILDADIKIHVRDRKEMNTQLLEELLVNKMVREKEMNKKLHRINQIEKLAIDSSLIKQRFQSLNPNGNNIPLVPNFKKVIDSYEYKMKRISKGKNINVQNDTESSNDEIKILEERVDLRNLEYEEMIYESYSDTTKRIIELNFRIIEMKKVKNDLATKAKGLDENVRYIICRNLILTIRKT